MRYLKRNLPITLLFLVVECQLGALAAPSVAMQATLVTGECTDLNISRHSLPPLLFTLPLVLVVLGDASTRDSRAWQCVCLFRSFSILVALVSMGPENLTLPPKLNHWLTLIITNEMFLKQPKRNSSRPTY